MKTMLRLSLLLLLLAALVAAGNQKTTNALIDESFEGSFPPSGWNKFSSGVTSFDGWQQSSDKSRTGTYSALGEVQYLYSCEIWLVSPVVDLSTASRAKLFFYEDADGWDGSGGTNSIEVSTTDNNSASAFTPVLTMTPGTHTIAGFTGSVIEVDLSAYVGQSTVYVAFHYANPGSPNYQWYIDDVKITVPSNHDVMAYSIDMDEHYAPNTTVQPKATISNEGLNAETFDVQFGYYDWNNNEVLLDTKTVTSLAAGAKTQVTFADYLFEKVGYTFFVKTLLSGDEDASNDLASKFINSYANQKDVVLPEEFTDTECTYCPGAAEALDSLYKTYPHNVAIIAYHGGFSGNDPFDNSYSTDRRTYYDVHSWPTCYFGGDRKQVGGAAAGSDWTGVYSGYEKLYLAEREEYTPLTMQISVTENGDDITATSTTTYQGITLAKDNHLRWALCESHIAYNWETSMDSLHFVERQMFPDANGTKMWNGTEPPAVGTQFENTINFTIPAGVVRDNCELIAFVQNDDTKEVMVAAKVDLGNPYSAIGQHTNALPKDYSLEQNYPNPFNPTTTISYSLPQGGEVQLNVFNSAGQIVKSLVDGVESAGYHKVQFNAADLASGIYFYTINAGAFSATKKMILIK